MDKTLKGSIALVTGASRGIGAATAVALAGLGAHVVIAARDDEGLTATDDAIRAAGGEATLLPADLTRADVGDQIGPTLYARFGRLDILVHASIGEASPGPIGDIAQPAWDKVWAMNVGTTWRLIRSAETLLRAAPYGRAVVMIDGRALEPAAYTALASASMTARRALATSWAAELHRTRLRVNLFDIGTLDDAATSAERVAAMCLPSELRHGATVRP